MADSIQGSEKRPKVRHSSSGLSSPRAEVVPGEQDVAAGRRAAVTLVTGGGRERFSCTVVAPEFGKGLA